MNDNRDKYLEQQKAFWNADDPKVAMFERVCTLDPMGRTDGESVWISDAVASLARVTEGVRFAPDWTVLELGCGVGRLIRLLCDQVPCRRIIGVDISEAMIRHARTHIGENERVELLVNAGQDLPAIASGSVDFAYSVDVFIHIHDLGVVESYLREVMRILKSGSEFRFNVRWFDPGRAFANTLGGLWAKLMYKLRLRSSGGHRWRSGEGAELSGNAYQPHELRRFIRAAGLQVVRLDAVRSEQVGDKLWCVTRKP